MQPVVPAPAPVAAPAPEPIAVTVPAPSAASTSVGVFLHLEDGERIWVGRFENQEAGELHAQYLIDSLMRPEPGVWPRFGDRLVRPESVVGVEVIPAPTEGTRPIEPLPPSGGFRKRPIGRW
jgi:hypothetical protein